VSGRDVISPINMTLVLVRRKIHWHLCQFDSCDIPLAS